MRIDELYNIGGFDPEHPSGNVLDAFEHHDDSIVVRQYESDGTEVVNRPLTKDEMAFFFPGEDAAPSLTEQAAVQTMADAFVNERIEAVK